MRQNEGSKTGFSDQYTRYADRGLSVTVTGAWVQDFKVDVEAGKVSAYRVNMKVTFILDE